MENNDNGNNLIIFRPASCDDSSTMIDNILNNKPVIANFENIDRNKAQRILDMLSGAMYAMSGTVRQVSADIYVFAPASMGVSGDTQNNSLIANTLSGMYNNFE